MVLMCVFGTNIMLFWNSCLDETSLSTLNPLIGFNLYGRYSHIWSATTLSDILLLLGVCLSLRGQWKILNWSSPSAATELEPVHDSLIQRLEYTSSLFRSYMNITKPCGHIAEVAQLIIQLLYAFTWISNFVLGGERGRDSTCCPWVSHTKNMWLLNWELELID